MATTTQVEVSRDPTGLVTRTETKQAFTWENPTAGCRSYRVTQNDGVTTIVEEFFDEMPVVYSLDVSSTTEPLESHPNYQIWDVTERKNWAIWKTNPSLSPNPALIPETWLPNVDGSQAVKDLFFFYEKGVTQYFAPRIVVKQSSLEDSAPNAALVGKISATGYPGNCGAVNFILLGISAQQEGNKYRVTREYLGSPAGSVWETGIYT